MVKPTQPTPPSSPGPLSAFSDAQKGFLAFDGCAEHNFLLRSIMTDSRQRKRNLLLTWLDLRDAFGSVPHHLMLHLMERLGLSGSVLDIVRDIYSHSTIAVRTGRELYTPAIPQNRGVKQGCPLSPIVFNIVHEGLLKYLTTNQAGYPIAGYTINFLAYADNVCVMASTKVELQGLLNQCLEFAEWAGLTFNVKKCGSLCLVNEASRIYADQLFTPLLGTEHIPALSWEERYKYLGCPVGAYRSPTNVLNGIVFASQLAEWQKLDAFRRFLLPRLCFVLKVVFPGVLWCQKLDTTLRTVIKRGLHIPPSACTKYFYLSQALGWMGIPSAVDESHVARAAQAFKFLADSRDPRIRDVALDQLAETVSKRAHYLDATKQNNLTLFLNTSAGPGEGRAGDLQSLWSLARASLVYTGASIELTSDSATLHTPKHKVTWDKRKQETSCAASAYYWQSRACKISGTSRSAEPQETDPHPPRHWWTNPLRRVRTNPPWHLRTNPHRPLMTPQWMLHAEPLFTPAVSTSSTHIHSHLHTHTHTPIHSTHQTHTHRCTTWSNHP